MVVEENKLVLSENAIKVLEKRYLKRDKDGKFSAGSINYLVYEKLKKYAESSRND